MTMARSKARSKLISFLFDHMTHYTWYVRYVMNMQFLIFILFLRYPTHAQYHEVLSSLVSKHPFLRDSSTSGYVSCFYNYIVANCFHFLVLLQQCLKVSLINKFKHERQPLASVEEVQSFKQKFGSPNGGRKKRVAEEDQQETPPKERRITVSLKAPSGNDCTFTNLIL